MSFWNKNISNCWYYTACRRTNGGLTKRACAVLFTEHKAALMCFSVSRQWLLTYQCFCSNGTDTRWTSVLCGMYGFQQIMGDILICHKFVHCCLVTVCKSVFSVMFIHFHGLEWLASVYSTHFPCGTLQHTSYICLHTHECSHLAELPTFPVRRLIFMIVKP